MPLDTQIQQWLSVFDQWLAIFGQAGPPAWLLPTAAVVAALLVLRVMARQLTFGLLGFLLGWLAGTGYWTQMAPWLATLWRVGGLP